MGTGNWNVPLVLVIAALVIAVLILRHQVQTWKLRANKIQDADSYFSAKTREADLALATLKREKSLFEAVTGDATRKYPWVAKIHGDLIAAEADDLATRMRRRKRPAFRAAEQLQDFKQDVRERLQRAKHGEYRAAVYESVYPFLEDMFETAGIEELVAPSYPIKDSDDPVKLYLSEAEYRSLPPAEKSQLALERYIERRKSSWEIGRDFERYVGYRYERLGYAVDYHGATRGLEDLGRDLIARKAGETLIVQCKYWSKWKDVHENAVFQLFGSTVDYAFEKSLLAEGENAIDAIKRHGIRPVFVTSTNMSKRAIVACEALGIEAKTNTQFDRNYPRIKCNVGKTEKLYHLPFDQQYDRVRIEPNRGEAYVSTAAEAERAGFRRAFRWQAGRTS